MYNAHNVSCMVHVSVYSIQLVHTDPMASDVAKAQRLLSLSNAVCHLGPYIHVRCAAVVNVDMCVSVHIGVVH